MARKNEGLGDRHIRIMRFLTEFQEQRGYSPSIREIGKYISVDSTSLVVYYLDQLCQAGYIEMDKRYSRSIRILRPYYTSGATEGFGVASKFGKLIRLLFSPDPNYIAAIYSRKILIWNIRTKKNVKIFDWGNSSTIETAVWSNDKNIILIQENFSKKLFLANIMNGEITLIPFENRVETPEIEILNSIQIEFPFTNNVTTSGILPSELQYKRQQKIQLDTLVYSNDYRQIAFVDKKNIRFIDGNSISGLKSLKGHEDIVTCVCWSPDNRFIASGCMDSSIIIWDTWTSEIYRTLRGHLLSVNSLAYSANGKLLYSCSSDQTIKVWDTHTGWHITTLEGHLANVINVKFSPDNSLLISQSTDGTLRLWHPDTKENIASISISTDGFTTYNFDDGIIQVASSTLPINEDKPNRVVEVTSLGKAKTLDQVDDDIPSIFVTRFNTKSITENRQMIYTKNYSNSKVVLAGDSGVGKSGLGLVLTGNQFKATDSTHGRNVWTFEKKSVMVDNGTIQTREILLWDLAGQPGYRLIHQLHLDEVSVAIVVFDSRSETDPFAGVRYWNRALLQSQRMRTERGQSLKKFLVAARVDRGGVGVSKDRIESIIDELGFDGYYETSAKEKWGILELQNAIRNAIDWQSLPNIVSTELFQYIRAFLLEEKKTERLLVTRDDLYHSFIKSGAAPENQKDLGNQFETVVGRLESNGLIRRLSFGNFVLLQPELLDVYASFIINAARDEPEGLGSILEENVLNGRFRMPASERVKDNEQEKLLLISAVEDMLRHEIALREYSEEGSYLVFPSQFTRERADLPDPQGKATILRFEGPVMNIYTTLAVRLSHSGIFKKHEMWKSAAIYRSQEKGKFGVFLREVEEGKGELILFYDQDAEKTLQALFEEFIYSHLKRRSLSETILRQQVISCNVCSFVITDQLIRLRSERGFDWVDCPVCSSRISFVEKPKEKEETAAQEIALTKMDEIANAGKAIETLATVLEGKKATGDFDVFISFSEQDEKWVNEWLLPRLEQNGIYIFREKNFKLGTPVIENIENALNLCPRTLLILTPNWVKSKWKSFDSLLLQTDDPANVQRKMIPMMLEACDVPKRIGMLARADFTKLEERDSELLRVITAIKSGD